MYCGLQGNEHSNYQTKELTTWDRLRCSQAREFVTLCPNSWSCIWHCKEMKSVIVRCMYSICQCTFILSGLGYRFGKAMACLHQPLFISMLVYINYQNINVLLVPMLQLTISTAKREAHFAILCCLYAWRAIVLLCLRASAFPSVSLDINK
jgi:hypothetical protein